MDARDVHRPAGFDEGGRRVSGLVAQQGRHVQMVRSASTRAVTCLPACCTRCSLRHLPRSAPPMMPRRYLPAAQLPDAWAPLGVRWCRCGVGRAVPRRLCCTSDALGRRQVSCPATATTLSPPHPLFAPPPAVGGATCCPATWLSTSPPRPLCMPPGPTGGQGGKWCKVCLLACCRAAAAALLQ